jgi:hypothetical protein
MYEAEGYQPTGVVAPAPEGFAVKLDIAPGDTLAVFVPATAHSKSRDSFAAAMERAFPGVKIVVLTDDVRLAVIHPEAARET